jgi:hypothetical protein
MSTRPKYFLLDAGPIIELHRQGLWAKVVDACDLVLPAVVVEHEALHWESGAGVGRPIDVSADIESGRVTVLEGRAEGETAVLERLDDLVRQRLHAGELEAIGLLATWPDEEIPEFCTADKMAVVALCLLGMASVPVSLEQLLSRVGFSPGLHVRFSTRKMSEWLDEGRLRFIQGTGLV